MPMYNLIKYTSNSSETKGSWWFYSNDEATNFNNIENNGNFKSFNYKAKLLGITVAQPPQNDANIFLKNATISMLLKCLSNFWRSCERPLINCKVELKLKWTKHCVLPAAGTDNGNGNRNNFIFAIKDAKSYITLSAKDNKKLS